MKRTNHAGIIGPTICNVVFGLYGGRVGGMFGAEGVGAK